MIVRRIKIKDLSDFQIGQIVGTYMTNTTEIEVAKMVVVLRGINS